MTTIHPTKTSKRRGMYTVSPVCLGTGEVV